MAIRFDEIELTSDSNHQYPILTNGGGNGLRIKSATGYGDFGSGNTSYFHISTDRGTFYVSKPVVFDGNINGYGGDETASFAKYFDSQDTSWYGDFNDQSTFNKVNIGGETSSASWKIYDSYVDADSSYLQTPQLTVRTDSSATGDIDHAHVQMAIFNRNGSNNTWTQLSLASREASGAGNTVSIAGIAAKKTSGTSGAWASGDLYLWTKKGATKIINLVANQDGHTQFFGNIYGNYSQNVAGTPVISGFTTVEGVENGSYHFTMPSISPNKFAGINWRGTVTADLDGVSVSLGANPFSVGNNMVGVGGITAGSTTSSILTIVISGENFSHASSAGIAFSAAAWRAKNVLISTSTDGTNYTERVNSLNNPTTTTYCTFSTGGTATTHVKYVLSNFNTTSCRISQIFSGDYTGNRSQVLNKYQPDTKYKSLTIDASGDTDNEYLVLKEDGAQRFRIYENNNNVYFDGGPGYTHFRPSQNGAGMGVIISGGPLYVSKIYDNDDTQYYLDPNAYNSIKNSYLWEPSSSTCVVKSYGENHVRLNRSGSGYVFALMGDDINENANNHGQNWEVSFDFNVESGNDSTHFGWAFNYQDENDFYAVVIRDNNDVRVQKQVNGTQTYPIASVTTTNTAGGTIDIDDGWHNCRIQKSKNYIIVEIDGVTQIATIIEANLSYDYGRSGFTIYDNACEFKNFSIRRGAVQQLILGSGVDPGSSWNGIYDDDNLVLTDGSLTINPHRRGDYGEGGTGTTSTTFNSRLNVWSDSEDHITFGGANTHMVSAWEQWKIWINNDSGSAGMLRLYNKNTKVEFGRLDGGGSSFLLGNLTTTLIGNVTGNVTGNVSGSSGSCTGNAATATSATSATSATTASNLGGIGNTGFYKILQDAGGYGTGEYHQATDLFPQPASDMVFGHNGTNSGLVACTLRHKIASSYYKNSSGTWQSAINSANYIDFNQLLGSSSAHAWAGTNLSRTGADGGLTQDFIMYMGNQQGYSFNGHLLVTHSTNGNSFIVRMETTATDPGISEANRVADVGTGGWTLKYTSSTISSWPGYSNMKIRQQVGGSAHAFVRFRFTPTWGSYGAAINLGHMSCLASYGNITRSLYFSNTGLANFVGDIKLNDSRKLQLGNGNDLEIYHDSAHSYIDNKVGGMFFREQTTDGNMVFAADRGDGGGTYDYFYLDGGSATADNMGTTTAAYIKMGNKTRLDLQDNEATVIKEAGGATGNYPAISLKSSGTTDSGAAIAIQQQTSEGDTIIFADYEPHVEWGISAENGANEIHFTGGNTTGNNGLGSKVFKNNAGDDRTAYKKMTFNLGTGTADIGALFTANEITSRGGILNLDDNGDADGVINAKASLTINIDADNNSTGEAFRINRNTTAVDSTPLLQISETMVTRFNAQQNSGSRIELYNNRQDQSNVEVFRIASYNSVEASGIHFYRGGGGAAGYATVYAKKNNASSLERVVKFGGDDTLDATFAADVIAYSDERVKENIETLDGKKVLEMRGVSYNRTDQDGRFSSGVIAQELEKVAPELVKDDGDLKAVAYGNLTGYLIEAIKDQQKQIDELKKIIKNGNNL